LSSKEHNDPNASKDIVRVAEMLVKTVTTLNDVAATVTATSKAATPIGASNAEQLVPVNPSSVQVPVSSLKLLYTTVKQVRETGEKMANLVPVLQAAEQAIASQLP